MREQVQDRYSNTIYLTDERWRHIIKYHPQLNGHRAKVLATIRSGKRRQDPLFPDKFYYKKTFQRLDHFKQIEVVVLFRLQNTQPNNFIVTAYPL
jgi:hypothetical protein